MYRRGSAGNRAQVGFTLGRTSRKSAHGPLQDSGCLLRATSASGTKMPAGVWPQLCPWQAPPVWFKGFEVNVDLAWSVQLSKIPQLWKGNTSSRMAGCNYSPLASPSSSAADY